MKTSNLFIAQQCDQAGETTEREQCIASGQVSTAQIEAHRAAGEIHSCSLYCERPACIKAQRNEYRQKLIDAQPVQSNQALQTVARLLQVHEGRKPEDALKIAAGMIGTQPTPERRPPAPDLKALVQKVHSAKGRHHNQIAMCDLYDACSLSNVRPTK